MERTTTITLEQQPFFVSTGITKNCDIDIHLHNAFEIFMATTNNIRYYIEGQAYDLQAGDLIITHTTEIHRPFLLDSTPYGRKFMLFNPSAFSAYLKDSYPVFSIFTDRKKGHGNHMRPHINDQKKISHLFDAILEHLSKGDEKSMLYAHALALQLFLHVDTVYNYCYSQNTPPTLSPKIDPRVHAILLDLTQNFQKKYCLDALAKRYHLDKYYMCHLFKKETGFSIVEYILSRRILHAKSLMTSTDLSLREISEESGFADYSNFFKAFKKLVTISPSAFQKNYTL